MFKNVDIEYRCCYSEFITDVSLTTIHSIRYDRFILVPDNDSFLFLLSPSSLFSGKKLSLNETNEFFKRLNTVCVCAWVCVLRLLVSLSLSFLIYNAHSKKLNVKCFTASLKFLIDVVSLSRTTTTTTGMVVVSTIVKATLMTRDARRHFSFTIKIYFYTSKNGTSLPNDI